MSEPTATACASCGWSTSRQCVVCRHHVCRCECIHGARLTAMTEPTPIPPEYITTGCGPGLRVMGERERRAVDEQRGADRMARAMVAALYWRAGERALLVREFADIPRAVLHYANEASALVGAALRLEACL